LDVQRIITVNMRKFNVMLYFANRIGGLVGVIAPTIILFAVMSLSDNFVADAGVILILYINIPLFLRGFIGIYQVYVLYKSGRPKIDQLREYNDLPDEASGDVRITSFESLETKAVSVSFEGGRIISIPDMRIAQGERVMFFGESGIGKSTIFNILMGLLPNYEGEIAVNGINLRRIDLTSLRDVFGITFQNVNVCTLTLEGNILLGADADTAGLIELAGLEEQSKSKAGQILNSKILSGGEKSRLGLAQTLARNPDIILIDEAFSNVDEEMERQIIQRLVAACPDKTIVCISHRSNSREYFDRVVNF